MKVLCAGAPEAVCAKLSHEGFLFEESQAKTCEDLVHWLRNGEGYEAGLLNFHTGTFSASDVPVLRGFKIDLPLVGLCEPSQPHMPWPDIRAHYLNAGLDDALQLPGCPCEVKASLFALARRMHRHTRNRFELRFDTHTLLVDLLARKYWLDDRQLRLTGMQGEVLGVLALRANEAVTGRELLAALYPTPDEQPESNVLHVMVTRLRKEMDPEHTWARRMLETVWGSGYRLNAE